MKRWLILTAEAFACAVGTVAVLYLGRIAAYYLLSRLFTAMNMSSDTYAAAPVWLRFAWNNTEPIGNITSLLFGICALSYLRTLFPQPAMRLSCSHIVLGACGMLIGFILVKLLVSLDCVREGLNGSAGVTDYIQDALICVSCALLIRSCMGEAINMAFGQTAACIVSAVAEAGVFWAAAGFRPVLIANGLLLGAILQYIYLRNKSVWPEVFLCAGFRIGARRLAGFPGTKVYHVSENLLTGGDSGLEGALILTTALALAAVIYVLLKRKEMPDGKKAAVSGKSVRRPEKN